jgi:Lrp/AsnC family leucine-responsive transcriptional regulator
VAKSSPHRPKLSAKSVESLKPLDEKDRLLLRLLQENSRISSAELARHLKLSAPGLQKRLKRLEENGFIEGYVTLVSREALGLDLLCFTQVTLSHQHPECAGEFCERMKNLPEVLECHHLTGEFDYLLKVVVPNPQRLEQFLTEKIRNVRGVDRIHTSIVLREVKTSTSLPLDASESER